MKYITILFLFIGLSSIGQEAKFQTYSADLLIIASKDSKDVQWLNKDILVNMDYKTGNISIVVKSNNFINKANHEPALESNETMNTSYTFLGRLPIEQILNQKTNNQEYTVELQLVNDEIDFSNEVNFKMNVMRTSQRSGSYRVFTLIGTIYQDDVQIPAFKEYDNEVEIRIMFNAYWNG